MNMKDDKEEMDKLAEEVEELISESDEEEKKIDDENIPKFDLNEYTQFKL